MCGIAGKLNFDRRHPVDAQLLTRMTEIVAHRGPDGSGHYLSGPVGLGHRRLSIIDLSTGDQPMTNEDGSVWVVFNGEIYNYVELRNELLSKGHVFKSSSDTEVIVHLYEELGDACVARFQGMFAFALWDERRQRLLLARDGIGIKPLYYCNTGDAIVFGSEIKSLLQDPQVRREVEPAALDRFLTYYYLPGEATLFRGILKLGPGHYLSVENGVVSQQQYWDLRFGCGAVQPSFDEAVEQLQQLLRRSVTGHLISDVPVGVLLSGGVDSTGILSHCAAADGRAMHTFTMGFAGNQFADERPYARLASNRYGSTHHEVSLSADEFRDFLPNYVWHMEDPVCEPPAIALYFVSRAARDASVKVLLSGEGGDEAFGGYSDYRNTLALESLKAGFGRARGLLKLSFQALARAGWSRGAHYAGLVAPDIQDYYLSRTASPLSPFNRMKAELYNARYAGSIADADPHEPTRRLWQQATGTSLLDDMLYVDSKSWLPDDLLVKADKMTMATSVELRVPLLDRSILEYAASLPQSYKVSGSRLKRVLKSALAGAVPAQILDRKKTGFPVPYDEWMRGPLRDFVHDTVLAPSAYCRNYFTQEALENLLRRNQQHKRHAKEIFCLLVLELWHRQFMAPSPSAAAP